jgi:ketosteroid isomerase-like protein
MTAERVLRERTGRLHDGGDL